MSNIGITTVLLTKVVGVPSAANEFVTSLNRLAADLQRGDLAAVAQDYVEFSETTLVSVAPATVETSATAAPIPTASGTETTLPSDTAAAPDIPDAPAPVVPPAQSVDSGSPAPAPAPAVNLQA